MCEFINAFSNTNLQQPIEDKKIIEAVCLSISSTQEAIDHYEALANACENPEAREILWGVANKERLHISELGRLILLLDAQKERGLEENAKKRNALVEYAPLPTESIGFSAQNLAIAS